MSIRLLESISSSPNKLLPPALPLQNNTAKDFYFGLNTKKKKKNRLVVYAAAGDGSGPGGAASVEAETTVVVEKKAIRFQVSQGYPTPFGATPRKGGVNFSISSTNSTSAILCLISLTDLPQKTVTEQISLDPHTNRTGDVWHIFVEGDFNGMLYAYKFDGEFDPKRGHYFDSSRILLYLYCKAVASRGEFSVLGPGNDCWLQMAFEIPSADDEVARNLGKTLRECQPTIRELQDVSREFKSTLEREIGLDEERQK